MCRIGTALMSHMTAARSSSSLRRLSQSPSCTWLLPEVDVAVCVYTLVQPTPVFSVTAQFLRTFRRPRMSSVARLNTARKKNAAFQGPRRGCPRGARFGLPVAAAPRIRRPLGRQAVAAQRATGCCRANNSHGPGGCRCSCSGAIAIQPRLFCPAHAARLLTMYCVPCKIS